MNERMNGCTQRSKEEAEERQIRKRRRRREKRRGLNDVAQYRQDKYGNKRQKQTERERERERERQREGAAREWQAMERQLYLLAVELHTHVNKRPLFSPSLY